MKNSKKFKNYNYVIIFEIKDNCINCIPTWIRNKSSISTKVSEDNRIAIIGHFDENMIKEYEYYSINDNWAEKIKWVNKGLWE